jgi:predicted alpha/beta hydrolase
MAAGINQESLMVPVGGKVQLHLRRLWSERAPRGAPILMLQGAAEEGHIFYSSQGHGLGCFLAHHGYQVFVPDLRGKGKSWPAINQHSSFGFFEQVTEDIPALAKRVSTLCDGQPQTWITHSLGGVLAAACLLRDEPQAFAVRQLVHFAARRRIHAQGFKRRLLVDLLWRQIGRMAVAYEGYLPAPRLGLGTARESARSFRDAVAWCTQDEWIDTQDAVDYGAAARSRPWLRSLYFASLADKAFGNPEDVRDFMHELGRHDGRLLTLSKAGGNLQDYSHVGMLLHPDAEKDHFAQLLEWLREGETAAREPMPSVQAELNL